MHILSPETDNCLSWVSGRERMTVENISWSISTKECCRPRQLSVSHTFTCLYFSTIRQSHILCQSITCLSHIFLTLFYYCQTQSHIINQKPISYTFTCLYFIPTIHVIMLCYITVFFFSHMPPVSVLHVIRNKFLFYSVLSDRATHYQSTASFILIHLSLYLLL